MSIEAINAVAKMHIEPSGRKFVAMALANYADENWTCFPSAKKLAAWTSQGEKTIRRHLDDLEECGFIIRDRQRREDGTLGVYRFHIQRSFSPEANLASGQNVPQPAAKMAAHNHQDKPSSKDNNNASAKWTALPDDWEPSQQDMDCALKSGWTYEHVRIEAIKFRNYWTNVKPPRGLKKSWPRTWQSWVLNNLPSNRGSPPKQESYSEIGDRLIREMQNERSKDQGDNRVIDLFPAVRSGS